jgi:hypothetical protein
MTAGIIPHTGDPMLPIQTATITRDYPEGPESGITATKCVTLNGYYAAQGDRAAGKVTPYAVGDRIADGHVWAGWRVSAIVDCGCISCD